MTAARLPIDERERLVRLNCLAILDTPPDPNFDIIAQRALAVFPGTTIAAISFVDSARQWFKSVIGMEQRETHRNVSFCAHAILGTRALVVTDATLDARFADNTLVTGDPGIRFYAGAPLANGLGSLCVIAKTPLHPTSLQIQELAHLARCVDGQLLLHATIASLGRT